MPTQVGHPEDNFCCMAWNTSVYISGLASALNDDGFWNTNDLIKLQRLVLFLEEQSCGAFRAPRLFTEKPFTAAAGRQEGAALGLKEHTRLRGGWLSVCDMFKRARIPKGFDPITAVLPSSPEAWMAFMKGGKTTNWKMSLSRRHMSSKLLAAWQGFF